jgi:hypothetical protein
MPYPKVDSHQTEFEEDLTLFIVKSKWHYLLLKPIFKEVNFET